MGKHLERNHVVKKEREAFVWCRKAAEQGDAEAQCLKAASKEEGFRRDDNEFL